MAAYNELDVVGQNKARQKRLSTLAEIGCILLFILFLLHYRSGKWNPLVTGDKF